MKDYETKVMDQFVREEGSVEEVESWSNIKFRLKELEAVENRTGSVIKKTLRDIKRDLDYLIINIEIDNENVPVSMIDAITRLHSELNSNLVLVQEVKSEVE